MIYRNFKETESWPVVTFGGASLSGEGGGYGFGEMSEKSAQNLIKFSFEAGITVFDTAPIYGFGLSEERLGRYLPREAKVVSKSGVDWHDSKRVNRTNDPVVTEKMLHASLKRLKREMIDVYMVHWPDSSVDIRRPLEIIKKAQEQGKVKHIGLCNTNLEDLQKAKDICEIGLIQSELNLFNQKPFDDLNDEFKSYFSMSWGTFDKGILTGRVTAERKFTSDDARSWAPWWNKKEVTKKIEKVNRLKKILNENHLELTAFCISYNLHYYGVSTCLVGFKTEDDVLKVKRDLEQTVSKEMIEKILKLWKESIEL